MTRHFFSDNDVARQREINSRVERITGSIPTAPNRHKESPVSESGSAEYNGYFKVIIDPDDDTKIKIIDGVNPSNENCGYTDLGAVSSVSITKQLGTLFLNASYVDNAYVLSFSFSQGDAYFVIASITADGIIQRWQAGDIYFTSRYFA